MEKQNSRLVILSSILTSCVITLAFNLIGYSTVTFAGFADVDSPVLAPVLAINTINPGYVISGACFNLKVSGTGFVSTSNIFLNKTALVTTYVSSTTLTSNLCGSSLPSPGAHSITVINSSSGGGISNSKTFVVNSNNLNSLDIITSISPSFTLAGAPAFTLTVNGTGFTTSSAVYFNLLGLTTTYISSSQLTATVPTSYIVTPGSYNINVASPTEPTGGISNSIPLQSPKILELNFPPIIFNAFNSPRISGSKIVWLSEIPNTAFSDIYIYDLNTNQNEKIPNRNSIPPWGDFLVAIDGNKVVYDNEVNGNRDIYLYDLSTNQGRRITTDPGVQVLPDISGNKIVWIDYRNTGGGEVYMYDLTTNQEKKVVSSNLYSDSGHYTIYKPPAIYGNKIVYVANDNVVPGGNKPASVYLYDLDNNQERRISTVSSTNKDAPAIFGNKIVWLDNRNAASTDYFSNDIYLYDLTTNQEKRITGGPLESRGNPAIFSNNVVWYDPYKGIYLYNLATSQKSQITSSIFFDIGSTDISNDYIVWEYHNGNIPELRRIDVTYIPKN